MNDPLQQNVSFSLCLIIFLGYTNLNEEQLV